MAKKEIKGEEGKGKTPEEAKAEKAAAAANDVFTFVADPESKLAPQAQCIVNILKEAGKKGLTRKELLAQMEEQVTTRQPINRILAYYQKKIQEVGAVKMEKA